MHGRNAFVLARHMKKKQVDNIIKYSNLGAQMLVIIFVAVFGGVKLDAYLSLHFPIFTLLFSLLGIIAAIYNAVKDFIKPGK